MNAGAKRLLLTHIPVWTSQTKVLSEAKPVFTGDVAVAVAGGPLHNLAVRLTQLFASIQLCRASGWGPQLG